MRALVLLVVAAVAGCSEPSTPTAEETDDKATPPTRSDIPAPWPPAGIPIPTDKATGFCVEQITERAYRLEDAALLEITSMKGALELTAQLKRATEIELAITRRGSQITRTIAFK